MEFNQLYYFLQVCKYGSFSKAARNINITQQAISKSISKLETEINLPLFNRSSTGVTLTQYGLFLQKRSENIINELDYISLQLKQLSEDAHNTYTIKLCVSSAMASFLSFDIFKQFQLIHSNINILVSEDINLECEKKVLNGDIDAAITIGPFDNTKFDIIQLTSYNMLAIVNTENNLALNNEITFEDLKNQQLVGVTNKSDYYLLEQCKKVGFEPNIVFSSMDVVSNYSYCSNHNCIGFGAENILRKIAPTPSVRLIPFKDDKFKIGICLITRKSITKPNPLETLTKYFKNHAIYYQIT